MLIKLALDEEHRQLKERMRRLAADLEAKYREKEEEDPEGTAKEMVKIMGREGILKPIVPKGYGGAREGVDATSLCLIREHLAYSSALADTMFAMQGLGSYPVTLAGREEQKQRYLPRVASGDLITTFALTEPGAGSDAAAIEARAERKGRGYVLNGQKRFISNAGIAGLYIVFAKTDPDKGAKGISAFIVEDATPGLSVKRTRLIAPHPIGEVSLKGVEVPEENLLGEEGAGFKLAMQTLDLFRATVGAAAVGLAQRALDEAISYSRVRVQFGRPLSEFQAIRFKLAKMATQVQAGRLLVYQAAVKKDREDDKITLESSMAKLYATEMAQEVVDQALQIHGGLGVVHGTTVERLYRGVRALRIYEGTSEIQHLVIANELLRNQGETS